ncbi:NAD(P)-dependent oxidoreductase [Cohnella sp. LGH]|uniref:NAD-dependent epimerase/dehydratase family protein n=1 Tax=Cohnella sp. LGH TaxID=1619153 RepID=UPI001ADB5F40|nr:NAD(P)-dependent oxidoreductase [Cohnella sp. LGH]QTH42320.1 NAD(P)-dependent oxidoreductase [Cohnella sp. LGH]
MSHTLKTEPICISILGSTSHVAKNIIYYFGQDGRYRLILFARSTERVQDFLAETQMELNLIEVRPYEEFDKGFYDVVINCVGVTQGNVLNDQPNEVFQVGEKYDNYALKYIKVHPACLYIHISSGAVYGGSFENAVNSRSQAIINVNELKNSDYYGIAKLYIEAKHRSLNHLNIVDLRVFSFFSRFIDLNSSFLLSDIINCLKKNEALSTNNEELVRDFLHPLDLINMIQSCVHTRRLNESFDLYSKSAISKSEILNFFQGKYGLQIESSQVQLGSSVGGQKRNYFSENNSATKVGYFPQYSSLDCIRDVAAVLLFKLKE